jgi:hypothetical protein
MCNRWRKKQNRVRLFLQKGQELGSRSGKKKGIPMPFLQNSLLGIPQSGEALEAGMRKS